MNARQRASDISLHTVGPQAYERWRRSKLGAVTEQIEQASILDLAGELTGLDVLDVGCGDGAFTALLWRQGARTVTGVDPNPTMITAAAARTATHKASISLAIGRVEQLPYPDRSFDIVVAVTVLCFVTDVCCALREIARVLKPGGRLAIGELGKWSLWALSRRIRGWSGHPTWRTAHFRTASQLCSLVEQTGFHVLQTRGAIYYPPCSGLARFMASWECVFSRLTTVGAAFLVVLAERSVDR